MPSTISQIEATHSFAATDEQFLRALDALDESHPIRGGGPTDKRGAERKDFGGNPLLSAEWPPMQEQGEAVQTVSLRVWGRDLSRGGMNFLFDREAVALSMNEEPTSIDVDALLRGAAQIAFGFNQANGDLLWLSAQVLRIRPVHYGLCECGVHFLKRLPGPSA